tara:strand:+ start:8289 stop:8531 length:243 start_codon:yes stop_codon:yes gene_type:complete
MQPVFVSGPESFVRSVLDGPVVSGPPCNIIPLPDSDSVSFALLTASATIAPSGACGRVTRSGLGMTISTITMTTPRAGTG